MKRTSLIFHFLMAAIFAGALPTAAQFQLPDLGSLPTTAPGADFATFAQLFGKNAAFTARSEVRVRDEQQRETLSTIMDLTMLDNKLRLDIDTSTTKNQSLPPGAAESLRQMGFDQVVILMRPDRQKVHFLFPKTRIGLNLPMEKGDIEKAAKATITTEPLGEETLDGHSCKKSKVTITSPGGEKQELTVWRATDLKDFPIQTVQKQEADTVTTRYSRIQFAKPDAKKFEPPTDVELHEGLAAFMQGMMKKALGSGLPSEL